MLSADDGSASIVTAPPPGVCLIAFDTRFVSTRTIRPASMNTVVADVVSDHADELLSGALEPLQILVLVAEVVLQPLHVDRVPDAGEELDRLDRLVDVHDPAGLEALSHVLRPVPRGDEDHRDV